MHAYIYPCKNIIGGLNIGDVIQKLPIAKIYSSPIFRLIRYMFIRSNTQHQLYAWVVVDNTMPTQSETLRI